MAKTDPSAQALDPAVASQDVAEQMRDHADWPAPGDEGFVHPDGTPQAATQLAQNQQAATDRAKVGAVAHGAPLATPGPQAGLVTSAVVEDASKVETPAPEASWAEQRVAEKAQEVAEAQGAEVTGEQPSGEQPSGEGSAQ